MKKETKIQNLIKIADFLDKNQQTEEANFIDSLIQEEQDFIDIPEEEYDFLQRVYQALGQSLK